MSNEILINFAYVVSAALFIFGLKQLGSPATARRGNMISSLAMLVAVVFSLLDQGIIDFKMIAISMVIGSIIGATIARICLLYTSPSPRD